MLVKNGNLRRAWREAIIFFQVFAGDSHTKGKIALYHLIGRNLDDKSYRKSGFSFFDCLRDVTKEHIDFLSSNVSITRNVQLEAGGLSASDI